jgi:hypothetical protein
MAFPDETADQGRETKTPIRPSKARYEGST